MGVRMSVLELRRRVAELQARLEALSDRAQRAGGGDVHKLVDRVDGSAVEALGWVRAARKAVRQAAARGVPAGAVRDALTEAQHHLDQLRRKEPRRLRGRLLAGEVDDLYRRSKRESGLKGVGPWAEDTLGLLRGVREALRRVDAAVAACWREVAADGPRRVTVRTETVVE